MSKKLEETPDTETKKSLSRKLAHVTSGLKGLLEKLKSPSMFPEPA